MESDTRATRWLGAAFVAQFVTSLAAGVLAMKMLTGGASQALIVAASNPAIVRASALLELLTAAGITALTALLFAKLGDLNRPRALVALGMWIGEVGLTAIRALGLYALAALGTQAASGSGSASSLTGAGTLALGLYQNAYTASMLFFCLGGLLWYSLLYGSALVPRWLAGWGFLGVLPLLVSTLLTLWDRSLSLGILPGLPYAPFELVVGTWLIVTAGRTATEFKAAKNVTAAGATAPANLKGALS